MNDVHNRVDAYYEHLGIDVDDLAMQRRRSVALNNRGDILLDRGDLSGALTAYEESRTIIERLAVADPSNAGWQRDLSVSLNKVGDSRAAHGDLAGALTAYEESRTIFERLAVADPSNAGWQRDLAVSFEKVGNIRMQQGDMSGASAAYEKALEIAERLSESDPSYHQWQIDVIELLGGSTQKGLVDADTAAQRLRRAIEMLEGLESSDRLHGEHREWPDHYRRRLETLGE